MTRPPSAATRGSALLVPDLDRARAVVQQWKAAGLRVVLANGCFDLIHCGHVFYLLGARAQGDRLVVAVNDDAAVRHLKGPGRPYLPLAQRLALVAALAGVDLVVPFAERDLRRVLQVLRPHIHCKGGDYARPEQVPEFTWSRQWGIETRIVGGPKVQSTRWLLRWWTEAGHRTS